MARKASQDPRAKQQEREDESLFSLKPMAGSLAISGAILLIGVFVIWDIRGSWSHWPLSVMTAMAIVALALAFRANPRAVLDFVRRRQTQQGVNAFVSAGLMLAIVVLINWIAIRHDTKADWTKSGSNTLDPQSYKILRKVNTPLEIRYYYGGRGGLAPQADRLLNNVEYGSRNIKAVRISIERSPDRAQQDGISAPGQAIVMNVKTGKKERPLTVDEQSLDSAILKVMSEKQKKICFLKGHGERDPADSTPNGYSTAKDLLDKQNYKVDTVALLGKGVSALEDCDVLIIAGPTSDLLEGEDETLRQYLIGKKGKALIMLDPPEYPITDLPRAATPRFNQLVGRFGLDVQKGLLIEPAAHSLAGALMGAGGAVIDVAVDPTKHDLLRTVQRGDCLFMFALGMRQKTPSGADAPAVTTLFETSTESWSETSQQELRDASMKRGSVKRDPDDIGGPLIVAAAVTIAASPSSGESKLQKSTRAVVVGDSDFASNHPRVGFEALANGRFFLAAVSWLTAEEEVVTIPPKPPAVTRIDITQMDQGKVKWGSLLPGVLVMVAGVGVWWRRR